MKYLIFFLSFFIATNVSAQLEFDSLSPYLSLSKIPVEPLHIHGTVYYGSTMNVEPLILPGTDWVITSDPVITIEGETKVIGVCQIIEDGRIRYGLTVEVSNSEGTMLTIFPLPTSDNLLWEQLVQKQK